MTETVPPCPACSEPYAYAQGLLWICPMCGNEWSVIDDSEGVGADPLITDAHGTPLADGDTVTVIKDLKVKGSSLVVKIGTKVRGIRLAEGFGGHDIDCKIDGVGPMQLKSEFVKKS
jgi:protein PhnA